MSRRKKHKSRSGAPNGGNQGPGNGQPSRDFQRPGSHQPQGPGGSSQNRTSNSSEPRVIQAESPSLARGQIPVQSVMVPRRNIYKKQMHQRNAGVPTKRYGIIFYDTLQAARNDATNLEQLSKQFDQLNIVIRAELATETPDLAPYGKVFAGAAWALIHERRKQDGWYEEPHE